MKRVHKSVLLWYSPREMFDLVTAIEDYPRFLPWCDSAEVIERSAHDVVARLTLVKGGVRYAFTTHNRYLDGTQVSVELVDGPFSALDGHWQFLPVGISAACRIEFDLRYAFSNAALEALVSPVFDRIANTMVDSFVARAEQVHGPR